MSDGQDAIVTRLPLPERERPGRRRHIVRWVVLGIVLVLIAFVLWIVVRGLIARDELTGAIPLVEQIKAKVVAGDAGGIQPLADELEDRASTAAALTSDPIWRAAELIPWVGQNLTAFREAAHAVDTVTAGALPPLVELAGSLDFSKFLPKGGVVDLAAIQALQPALAQAGAAMAQAAQETAGIDTSGTVPQIGGAVAQLVGVVSDANSLIGGANGLVQVLPAMLGADGPRTILLLVQNNAELRATGGIPGAITELRTDAGRIAIGTQTSAVAIGEFATPVLPVTDAEKALYSDKIARFMQDVTVTPDFGRAGQIAAAMWKARYGEDVDAVVAVDPVVLSYLLGATGPITLDDGTTLDQDNAVETLLNQVYFRFPNPADQDAFFASAARTIFDDLMSFTGDPKKFVDALGQGIGEHRVYVWSAHPDEQSVIASGGSSLSSLLPTTDATAAGFGVYLVDTTMSKIDWYLTPSIAVGGVQCPSWGNHTYYELQFTLASTMPPGGVGVPDYVVGPSIEGDARGTALTTAYLTLPAGYQVVQTVQDGRSTGIKVVDAGDAYAHYSLDVELPPGKTTVVTFRIWGPVGAPSAVRLIHTPTAGDFATTLGEPLECPSPNDFPTEGPVIAAGRAS